MHELSQEAGEIDGKFDSLSRCWGKFANYCSNAHGYELVTAGVEDLKKMTGAYSPKNTFESLWLENVKHQVSVMDALASHYYGIPGRTNSSRKGSFDI